MRAIRLHGPAGPKDLLLEEIDHLFEEMWSAERESLTAFD